MLVGVDAPPWAAEPCCHLTTTGRRTGRPHTVEIWFAWWEGRAWLLTEPAGTADWVRNVRADGRVRLRVGAEEREAAAAVHDDLPADHPVRAALAAKYQASYGDRPLLLWARGALAVAVTPAG